MIETMLSEKQAWEYLAEVFTEKNREDSWASTRYVCAGYVTYGLCTAVGILVAKGMVSSECALILTEKIEKAVDKRSKETMRSYVYLAPLDAQGAETRRQFCLEQASML